MIYWTLFITLKFGIGFGLFGMFNDTWIKTTIIGEIPSIEASTRP